MTDVTKIAPTAPWPWSSDRIPLSKSEKEIISYKLTTAADVSLDDGDDGVGRRQQDTPSTGNENCRHRKTTALTGSSTQLVAEVNTAAGIPVTPSPAKTTEVT